MGSPNEGRCCDAVIRALEERLGVARSDPRFPEKEKRVPPIEVEVRLGVNFYAIEHTQFQSLPGQIEAGKEFVEFIEDINAGLVGHLPKPGVFYLLLPMSVRVPTKQVATVKAAIIAWVKAKALELHTRFHNAPPRRFRRAEWVKETPASVPYPLWIKRETYDHPVNERFQGTCIISRIAPENLDDLRLIQMEETLSKKNPKLALCKAAGARSILVLEDADISLAGDHTVVDLLQKLAPKFNNMSDEIWLVSTTVQTWYLLPLYLDGQYPPERQFSQFERDQLIDLTGSDAAS